MGRDDYRKLIRAFLEDTREAGDVEVIVDVNETRIDQDYLDQVARELGAAEIHARTGFEVDPRPGAEPLGRWRRRQGPGRDPRARARRR